VIAPVERMVDRAGHLQAQLEAAGVPARLLGGVGVSLLLGARMPRSCLREPGDIDLAVTSRHRSVVSRLLERLGYVPDLEFNLLQGKERLAFYGPDGTRVDVVVDILRMCHVIDLSPAFIHPGFTLPAWLLLLTKLQVVELTAKDRSDVAALMAGCEPEDLELPTIAKMCADDWGLWRTVTGSLAAVVNSPQVMEVGQMNRLRDAGAALSTRLEIEPKSIRWRVRARIGERVRWYELPEAP
jgi:hypothetical protein